MDISEAVFFLCSNLVPEFVDDIGGVCQVLGFLKFPFRGFP